MCSCLAGVPCTPLDSADLDAEPVLNLAEYCRAVSLSYIKVSNVSMHTQELYCAGKHMRTQKGKSATEHEWLRSLVCQIRTGEVSRQDLE